LHIEGGGGGCCTAVGLLGIFYSLFSMSQEPSIFEPCLVFAIVPVLVYSNADLQKELWTITRKNVGFIVELIKKTENPM